MPPQGWETAVDSNREPCSRFCVMTCPKRSTCRVPLGFLATLLLLMFSRVVIAGSGADLVISPAAVFNDIDSCTHTVPPGRNQDSNDARRVIVDDQPDPRPRAQATVSSDLSFTAGFDHSGRSPLRRSAPLGAALYSYPVYLLTERFRL